MLSGGGGEAEAEADQMHTINVDSAKVRIGSTLDEL